MEFSRTFSKASSSLSSFLKKQTSFILFLVAIFAVRWTFADQYYIPSGSMEPTLQIGDRILVNKMAYDLKIPYTSFVLSRKGEPQRGDIIVFENPRDGVTMVKRIIAIPNDKVEIDDGFVKINGQPIEGTTEGQALFNKSAESTEGVVTYHEHFGDKNVMIQRLPFMSRPHHFSFEVPADQYFAMGDNRDNSADSRVWGFVPRDRLKGRAFAVFWNLRFESFVPKVDFDRAGMKVD